MGDAALQHESPGSPSIRGGWVTLVAQATLQAPEPAGPATAEPPQKSQPEQAEVSSASEESHNVPPIPSDLQRNGQVTAGEPQKPPPQESEGISSAEQPQAQQDRFDANLREDDIKEELVKFLAQKQRALKKAREISERLKKGEGLHVLTMDELKEIARKKGVSIYMTRQDVIDLLDNLEPDVDHSGLKGKSLIEVQNRYHIPTTKNKRQLIKAIEKVAREEAAEKVTKEKP